jgi:hypothetical protein
MRSAELRPRRSRHNCQAGVTGVAIKPHFRSIDASLVPYRTIYLMDMYFRANIFLVGLIRYNQTKACVQTSGRVGTSVDGQYLRETEEQSKDATVTLRRGIYMEATDVAKTGPLAACARASRCFTRVCA